MAGKIMILLRILGRILIGIAWIWVGPYELVNRIFRPGGNEPEVLGLTKLRRGRRKNSRK
jgi:hypothetical protein